MGSWATGVVMLACFQYLQRGRLIRKRILRDEGGRVEAEAESCLYGWRGGNMRDVSTPHCGLPVQNCGEQNSLRTASLVVIFCDVSLKAENLSIFESLSLFVSYYYVWAFRLCILLPLRWASMSFAKSRSFHHISRASVLFDQWASKSMRG
jgi:hypothetical protein